MPGQGYKQFQNEEELPQSGQNDTTSKPTNNANTDAMGQPMAGPGQPLMAPGQPVNTSGQPMMATGQPMNAFGQPVNTSGQPMTATGQPMMAPGQPMNASDQPVNTSGQPIVATGQPMMAPGQPMNTYGQPLMAPGQPMNASGQPMMAPGQPILAPGQYGYNFNQSQFPYVVNQQPGMPTEIQLMPPPSAVPGCPPGLEYLVQLDQVLVHQPIELAEVLTGVKCENKYIIKNSLGQQVYFASEGTEPDDCIRVWCVAARGFTITLTDNLGQDVMHVTRIFKCCSGCCWCAHGANHCSYFIEVESPPGTVIGYIRQTMSFTEPHFDIKNADNQCVLKIRGRLCCRCQGVMCTDDIEFKIITKDGRTELGKVSKQWGGLLKERYTRADNFGVQFPADMDVKTKALLLASTFLIDFMFFENPVNNARQD